MTAARKRLAWLERPVPPGAFLLIGLGLLLAPGWLFADALGYHYLHDIPGNYRLILDDFPYATESRTFSALGANLWKPHNAHVVPLFRAWTFLLCKVAGSLANLTSVLGTAAYATLALVMLAGGHLVAREAQSKVFGSAAMAGLGLTTVMEPATTWYAAGQALWAGLMILAMLLALQSWRMRGGRGRLVLALLAAFAAPAFWSGGYAAGPTGLAYLWTDGRPACRKAAVLPLLASVFAAFLLVGIAGFSAVASSASKGQPGLSWLSSFWGLCHMAQAIPEVLLLNNLGLDARSSAPQGLALCLGLLFCWLYSHRGGVKMLPLEAAGGTLVVASFLLVFTFRGSYPYDSLRALGWYHAIPQIGAVLLLSGWWLALSPKRRPEPSRGQVLGVLGLAFVLAALNARRAETLFLERYPFVSPIEARRFPTRTLQRLRDIYLADERSARQRRVLSRLDRAEVIARARGLSKHAIRRRFGRVTVPGWPEQVQEFDALDLLDLPRENDRPVPNNLIPTLATLLAPEPEPPLPWLQPAE
jgi:hypothetical protein